MQTFKVQRNPPGYFCCIAWIIYLLCNDVAVTHGARLLKTVRMFVRRSPRIAVEDNRQDIINKLYFGYYNLF